MQTTQTVLVGEETDFPPPDEAFAPRRIREPHWDYLRFAATAAVVLIHVIAYAFNANAGHVPRYMLGHYGALRSFSNALRWAVPSFALLTGALVWGRPWRGGRGAYRDFLMRRATVVAVPYVLWVTLYYLLRPSIEGRPWPQGGLGPVGADFLGRMLEGTAWFHLYFVPVVLALYILTPLASRVAHLTPEGLVVGLAAFATAWVAFRWGQPWLVGPWKTLLDNVIRYAPFAALGALLAIRQAIARRVLRWTWPPLLAGGLYGLWRVGANRAMYWGGFDRSLLGLLVTMAAVLGVLGLCWLVSGRWALADRAVGSLYPVSFGVYLVHPLVIAGLGSLALAFIPAKELLFTRDLAVGWLLAFAASWALVWLLLKTRATRWMV